MDDLLEHNLAVGSIFEERYEILNKLNEGGFGILFRARHIEMDRTVAIKFLKDELTGDAENRARFKREGRILSNIIHSNLVRLYHFGVTRKGRLYFVMEYLTGASLQRILQETVSASLPVDHALGIGVQVCRALKIAHENGIIHRDIKPTNIMLEGSQFKLVDFGLSRVLMQSSISVTEHLTLNSYWRKNIDRS